jgi:hypothetical protein
MTLEEKIAKVEVINKTILELKQMPKTQLIKLEFKNYNKK